MKFCGSCGAAFDLNTILEYEDKRKSADEIMNLLTEDGEVVSLLKRKIKEKGLETKVRGINQ
jgi:predicted double-glycine peptidase